VDDMWPNRPPIPQNKVKLHPVSLSGESVTSKLERVRKAVTDEAKADAIVMSALDQIGWLFNLRGSDIMCNPVFFSYALISESAAHLFLGRRDGNVDGVLDGETKEELVNSGVTLHSYTDFNVAFLPTLIKEGSYVLVEKVRWEARSATSSKFQSTYTQPFPWLATGFMLRGYRISGPEGWRLHHRDRVVLPGGSIQGEEERGRDQRDQGRSEEGQRRDSQVGTTQK
jgi:hypothetical protein